MKTVALELFLAGLISLFLLASGSSISAQPTTLVSNSDGNRFFNHKPYLPDPVPENIPDPCEPDVLDDWYPWDTIFDPFIGDPSGILVDSVIYLDSIIGDPILFNHPDDFYDEIPEEGGYPESSSPDDWQVGDQRGDLYWQTDASTSLQLVSCTMDEEYGDLYSDDPCRWDDYPYWDDDHWSDCYCLEDYDCSMDVDTVLVSLERDLRATFADLIKAYLDQEVADELPGIENSGEHDRLFTLMNSYMSLFETASFAWDEPYYEPSYEPCWDEPYWQSMEDYSVPNDTDYYYYQSDGNSAVRFENPAGQSRAVDLIAWLGSAGKSGQLATASTCGFADASAELASAGGGSLGLLGIGEGSSCTRKCNVFLQYASAYPYGIGIEVDGMRYDLFQGDYVSVPIPSQVSSVKIWNCPDAGCRWSRFRVTDGETYYIRDGRVPGSLILTR